MRNAIFIGAAVFVLPSFLGHMAVRFDEARAGAPYSVLEGLFILLMLTVVFWPEKDRDR